MAKKNKVWVNLDWTTITLFLLILLAGWINIYAAVYNEEHDSIFDFSQRYGKQVIWILASLIIAAILVFTDSRFYVTFAYPIYMLVIFLLMVVLIIGATIKGSTSWFQIGGVAFQPSEFAKFATALAISKYLSSFNFKMQHFRSMLILGFIILFPVGLIFLQHDTGSALVFVAFILVLYREGLSGVVLLIGLLVTVLFILTLLYSAFTTIVILFIMAFIAHMLLFKKYNESIRGMAICTLIYIAIWGSNVLFKLQFDSIKILLITVSISLLIFLVYSLRKWVQQLFLILGIFVGAVIFTFSVDYVFSNMLEDHQQSRIEELLGISSDPLGAGYNVNQSKIAIGSGGFFGKGFLNGTQTKYNFVPEQSTDFIFCTVGEEWGFIGSLFTVGLYLLLLVRLVNLAEKQRTRFSRIYGYSVASILFFHFAINIGMTLGLAPVIGIPLPFFSYGGSSLWSFTILLFIFLRLDASRFEQLGY